MTASCRAGDASRQSRSAQAARQLIWRKLRAVRGGGAVPDALEGFRLLRPVRHEAHRFGGSHAQRDLIDLTIIEAVGGGGESDLADALRAERALPMPWRRSAAEVEAAPFSRTLFQSGRRDALRPAAAQVRERMVERARAGRGLKQWPSTWLEGWYNSRRRHGGTGRMPPVTFGCEPVGQAGP